MVIGLNPRYQLPHKDFFSRRAIPSLYAKVRDKLEKKISSSSFYFSATADLWSSCTTQPYLGYTIHYIDSSWVLQSHCLQVHFMPESHSGINLQSALSATLQEWSLDEAKQISVTTNSGSNIKLACELLTWRRISCFGHNFDLAVRKGLDDQRINRVLRLCQQIVAVFSSSWKRTQKIK